MFRFLRWTGMLLVIMYGVALAAGRAGPVNKFTGYYLKQVEKTAQALSEVITKAGRGNGFSGPRSQEPSILRE